ncbi:uncharacterized protein AB675_5184 [Cyphellophora attinorum]|uniref:Ferritin-like domain-containing protein n=1 Tax=Cyphellophora attinorum TaxID=1664694 RepID=A0A0N1H3D3_9EURO|nr:uncharacterized protein AB675_5184 [Phialophora attinorum]KPI39493.1 hypothetical protein AB675_5184 [Phialophora attinorum]
MKVSTCVAAASMAGMVYSAPLEKRQNIDNTVLQFALTLEHLENVFYEGAIKNFTAQDFADAGYGATYYNNLKYIANDEQVHVQVLTAALQANGQTPGVGTSAYLGGAPLISSKYYLTVAGAILATEALHTSYQRAAIGEVPMANPFETPLNPNPVYTLAAQFIVNCPATNPPLPFKPFPLLTATSGTCVAEGPAMKKRSWDDTSSTPNRSTDWSDKGSTPTAASATASAAAAHTTEAMHPSGWGSSSTTKTSVAASPTSTKGASGGCALPSKAACAAAAGSPYTFTAANSIPAGSFVTFASGLSVASVQVPSMARPPNQYLRRHLQARQSRPVGGLPSEIAEHDHRDFLGKKEYQRAWVDFFEDQLVEAGYDWKAVVTKYIFEIGPKSCDSHYAMFDCLVSGLGHPLIHLGYAFELTSREVAMEALGLAATCYDTQLASLATTPPPKHIPDPTSDLFTLFNRVETDPTFDNLFTGPGGSNLGTLLSNPKLTSALLAHFHSWTITNPTQQFAQSQRLASLLLISTSKLLPQPGHDYDFFLVHLLTTSHAIRILLPFFPKHTHLRLVRQWLLITLAIYIAQLRPSLSQAAEAQKAYDLKGRGWEFVNDKALHGGHKYDAHFVKGCRAMLAGAKAWGDDDGFFLKNAVRFADEFEGWGGFGREDLEEMEEASQGHR